MATLTASPAISRAPSGITAHKVRLSLAIAAAAGLIAFLSVYGYAYYAAGLDQRPLLPQHAQLRSSGAVGLKLGMLGVGLFGVIFLYPLRKRWKWLGRIGTTRRWLDFHAFVGITAPIVITFHSAFKMHGVAGVAYYIMLIVAFSGFVGRYVYAQIPRSLNSVQLSMSELAAQVAELAAVLSHQNRFRPEDLAPLLRIPIAQEIRNMNPLSLLFAMLAADITRPFRVSQIRRRALSGLQVALTGGGLFRSGDAALESIVESARRQSRLASKMAFLEQAERLFHLWHVVHRPFSLSFVALVLIHLGVVFSLGYY